MKQISTGTGLVVLSGTIVICLALLTQITGAADMAKMSMPEMTFTITAFELGWNQGCNPTSAACTDETPSNRTVIHSTGLVESYGCPSTVKFAWSSNMLQVFELEAPFGQCYYWVCPESCFQTLRIQGKATIESDVPFWTQLFGYADDTNGSNALPQTVYTLSNGPGLWGIDNLSNIKFTFTREDFDASGEVDSADLSLLFLCYGQNWGRVDLDDNGIIDSADLSLLLLNFGDCSSSLTTKQSQEPMIFAMPEAAKPIAVKK